MGLETLPPHMPIFLKSRSLKLPAPSRSGQGLLYLYLQIYVFVCSLCVCVCVCVCVVWCVLLVYWCVTCFILSHISQFPLQVDHNSHPQVPCVCLGMADFKLSSASFGSLAFLQSRKLETCVIKYTVLVYRDEAARCVIHNRLEPDNLTPRVK